MNNAPPTAPDYQTFFANAYQEAIGNYTVPEILCHYTSMSTAQKILESDTIRFTNAHFMNDSQEIKKGLKIFWERCENFWNQSDNENHNDIALFLFCLAITVVVVVEDEHERQTLLDGLEREHPTWLQQIKQFKAIKPRDLFISCFSEESAKDSLPMWYMYGDHAKGVSICFDAHKLTSEHNDRTGNAYSGFAALKVIYDEAHFISVTDKYLKTIKDFLILEKSKNAGSIKHLQKENPQNDFFSKAVFFSLLLAISHKSHAFEHEKEWRLCCILGRDKKSAFKTFLHGNGVLKPVLLLEYNTPNADKTRGIVVGPANPNTVEWLKAWTSSIDATENIHLSDIPYRDI